MGNRVSSEEEKWKKINENWWLRRFLRSKWKVPIIAMLIGWYLMKDYDEKKKREKIRKRIMKILQPNSKRK